MDTIKFLGTAGARFVMLKQLRASGGIWLELAGTRLLIDPGPGTLVRCVKSRPRLDPAKLDGIVLTHKHLDHSSDINVMIEAMTEGGSKRRGQVFAPSDALFEDPVILRYVRKYAERITILKQGGEYQVGEIIFNTPVRHLHSVETYGLNIKGNGRSLCFITDTRYFSGLEDFYKGDILVINLVRYQLKPEEKIEHLDVSATKKLISGIKPRQVILTHFGMTMLQAKPWQVAAELQQELGVKVTAANDGMNFEIDQVYL